MTPTRRRCAIYTRKSSEEGLDQSFSSLHAQREACEAYVLSQAGEGWDALPELFDDGGFSGGNLDRPALRRLLAAVDAGLLDTVVVYKVDRLTRSLADFAKIVERFDAKGVTFVSVTQAFNTTTSMGRLTLNVLLSFAQFEREVTGERIRDKIALSKARGIWMGGMLSLGYDLKDRRLIVNEEEAVTVRDIFQRYLALKSVHLLRDELERDGVRSKLWASRSGQQMGGAVMSRGALFHMLQNRLYLGEIQHKAKVYPGEHAAIVDRSLFEAVQAQLRENTVKHRGRPVRAASAAFIGKIFNDAGEPMSPSFGYGKSGKLYRYYIAMPLQVRRGGASAAIVRRVSGPALEAFLLGAARRLLGRSDLQLDGLAGGLVRVQLAQDAIVMVIDIGGMGCADHPDFTVEQVRKRLAPGEQVARDNRPSSALQVRLAASARLRGGRAWFNGEPADEKPAAPSASIIKALRSAHIELAELNASPLTNPEAFELAEAPSCQHRRQLSRLPFLAPDLQRMFLEGTQPARLNLRTLLKSELPLAWEDQRAWVARLRATRPTA